MNWTWFLALIIVPNPSIVHYVCSPVRCFHWPFYFKRSMLYICIFWWVGISVVFCIAVEEAPKLNSSAKASGGEDAEVAYLPIWQPFCYIFGFFELYLFIYLFFGSELKQPKTWEFKYVDGESWCLLSSRVLFTSFSLSLSKGNSSSINAVIVVGFIFVIVVFLWIVSPFTTPKLLLSIAVG